MNNAPSIEQFAMTLDESKGPVCFPSPVDFRAATEALIDLTQLTERGEISFISGVFLNNWNNSGEITITNKTTGHSIVFPAYSQGFMPLFLPNPPSLDIETTAANGFITPIFYNTPIPPFMIINPNGGA